MWDDNGIGKIGIQPILLKKNLAIKRIKPENLMNIAKMQIGFVWVCDHCGWKNYTESETLGKSSYSDKDIRSLSEEYGYEVLREGELHLPPTEVFCSNCDKNHEVEV